MVGHAEIAKGAMVSLKTEQYPLYFYVFFLLSFRRKLDNKTKGHNNKLQAQKPRMTFSTDSYE